MLLTIFGGQEKDGGVGIENTADDAEDVLFKSIGSHVGTRLMVGPGTSPGLTHGSVPKQHSARNSFSPAPAARRAKTTNPGSASGNSPQKQLLFTENRVRLHMIKWQEIFSKDGFHWQDAYTDIRAGRHRAS